MFAGVPEEHGVPPAPTLGHPNLQGSGSRRGHGLTPGPLNGAAGTQLAVPAGPGVSGCSAVP